MKKTIIKKICAVLLSVAVLSSAFCTISASAAEEVTIISGDANFDGVVNIDDVTEIQKYLANGADFGVREKVAANVDDTKISIDSVTTIQKYLSGYDTDLPIGQAVDQGEDGIIVEENTLMYFLGITGEYQEVYYSTKYNDIPFIKVNDALDFYHYFYGLTDVNVEASDNGSIVKCTLSSGAEIEFNYNKKCIKFYDYDFSISLTGKGLDLFGSIGSAAPLDENDFLRITSYDNYFSGDPVNICLNDYSIPMLKDGENLYIPLATFNDIFISSTGIQLVSNGDALFLITASLMADKSSEFYKLYYSAEIKKKLTNEMTIFNYNELCLTLDLHYGLKDRHKISDFDSYLSRMGLKKEYLSGDVYRIEKANYELTTVCFADFHSSYRSSSPYFDKEKYNISDEIDIHNKTYLDSLENTSNINKIRETYIGSVEPYERIGDTVFITFDSFTFTSKDYYYSKVANGDPDLSDTVELFCYALERLKNEDSDVKNVVIDVSCNAGGAALGCGYAIDAVLGLANIPVYNPNTNAFHQNVGEYDLNLDGKIDENDLSMKELGKNIAIITSEASFSCGNLFPCNIKSNDSNVLLLGQKSGGGACVVGYVATATGTFMGISSSNQLVFTKNGGIQDIDDGINPDIYLSFNRMFDRDYITNIVSEQFAN